MNNSMHMRLLFWLSALLLLQSACAPLIVRNGFSRKDFALQGHVKSVTIYEYQPSGELFNKEIMYFDRMGKLLKSNRETYNPDGREFTYTTNYSYDEQGFLKSLSVHHGHSGWQKKEVFVNDRKGREKRMYFYVGNEERPQVSKTRYFDGRRMTKTAISLSDGSGYAYYTAWYNRQGKVFRSLYDIVATGDQEWVWRTWAPDGNLAVEKRYASGLPDTSRTTYEYDQYGNKTAVYHETASGEEGWTRNSYRYDEQGNWTSYTEETDAGFKARREQVIDYYPE